MVRLRSGHVVRLRQVRPGDAAALAAAYANLGEQSRYRRFFTLLPELPESVLEAATDVDHVDHEALVALPLLADEIVGECRFVRLADRADTADLAVTIVDEWQGRGLGTELLARLSERALEEGIKNFTAEVLAENRAMLGMLDDLGRVEAELAGPVVSARIKIAEADRPVPQELLDLLAAVTRGEVVTIPAPLRRLIEVTDAIAKIVLLPVAAVLRAARH
ncbi:MAG: GNAT family N-acetyltransferase [Pseudonocardia sp.]|nr:GNAT family N-acetyltransferase [Pseudonocardia sp.]